MNATEINCLKSQANSCQPQTTINGQSDLKSQHQQNHRQAKQHQRQQQQQQLMQQQKMIKSGNNELSSSSSTPSPLPLTTTTKGATGWKVKASDGAMNTSNPIREIIETMNLAENPNKKVIPLSIGDPTIFGNLKPCKEILEAIQKANSSGKFYGYQTAAGMEAARQAVAEYHYKCTGTRLRLQDVILASGCSHAIDLCICVLARSGQNILIPRPGFPLYKTLTAVYGVQYKQYDLLADQSWSIDLKHLESLIDDNTAAIVINNPSNPCGSVFSKRHLKQILRLAEKYRLPIIADEIYDKFVFTPESHEMAQNKSKAAQASSAASGINIKNTDKETTSTTTTTAAVAVCNCINQQNGEQQQQEQEEDIENRQLPAGAATDYISAHPAVKVIPARETISPTSDLESSIENDLNAVQGGDDYSSADISPTLSDIDDDEDDDNEVDDDDDDDDDDDELDTENGNDERFKYVPFYSLASLSENVPILTCGGISKTCLIPGLRLGWILINDRRNIFDSSVRYGLGRLTQRLMGPNSLVQGALPDILANVPDTFYKQTMDFIFQNAKLVYRRLLMVKGLQPYMPQGSMYLMVRFNPKLFPNINGDLDFTSKLMNEESVLVLPGKCFDFPNFFRVCLTVPTNVMEEALNRIQEFCERHAVVLDEINEIDTLIDHKQQQQQQKQHQHQLKLQPSHQQLKQQNNIKCAVGIKL